MKSTEGELGRERKFSADTDEVIFINNTSTNTNRQARVCRDGDHFNGTICTCKHVCVPVFPSVCVCVCKSLFSRTRCP